MKKNTKIEALFVLLASSSFPTAANRASTQQFIVNLSMMTGIKNIEIINESEYTQDQLTTLVRERKGILIDTRSNSIYNTLSHDKNVVICAALVPVARFGRATTAHIYSPAPHTAPAEWLRSFEKAVMAASHTSDRTVTTTSHSIADEFLSSKEAKQLLKQNNVALKIVNINTLTSLTGSQTLPSVIWGTAITYNEVIKCYASMTNLAYGVTEGFITSDNIISILPSTTCGVFVAELCNTNTLPREAVTAYIKSCEELFIKQPQHILKSVLRSGNSYFERVVVPVTESILRYRTAVA